MKTTSLLIALSLLTWACNDVQDKENTTSETLEPTPEKPKNTAVVSGIYASNTFTRIKVYHAINLIDGDTTTYWRTPKGAGPDEGITIQFETPTYIKSVSCYQPKKAYGAKIKSFETYADGVLYPYQQEINKAVSTLYIRLNDITKTEEKTATIDGFEVKQKQFNPESYVAVGEVLLTGKDGELIELENPTLISGKIITSSSLTPAQAYGPENLFDCKKDFGWAEGAPSTGIGEKINIRLQVPAAFDQLKIWNGYQRSEEHFKSNARLKSFDFGPEGGPYQTFEIEDTQEPISLSLKRSEQTVNYELIVKDVYPGSKYEDLVISELKFYDSGIPVIILPRSLDDIVFENTEKANALFKKYLDRNINISYNKNEGEYASSTYQDGKTSMIIRSNNSFVLFQTTNESVESDAGFSQSSIETIAEGNWELINQSEKAVKIRIFGKIYQVSSESELYKGDETSESTKIFQDELTLTNNSLEGKKFIKKIMLP